MYIARNYLLSDKILVLIIWISTSGIVACASFENLSLVNEMCSCLMQ